MRAFGHVRRIVIKIGTNLLSTDGGIDLNRIRDIAIQVSKLKKRGIEVILVSSGAIGMGAMALGIEHKVKHIPLRQACAAVGQPLLMSAYEREFRERGVLISQMLITRANLNNRKSYLNLRESVSTSLKLGIVPIFNENDTVSTKEIGNVFGDNDRMSAMIASKIEADLLIILTDIDGVYTANPKTDPNAKLIPEIESLTEEIMEGAGAEGSVFGTGGMKTKMLACQIARDGGCGIIIAPGYEKDVLARLLDGEDLGTYIHPARKISAKERWMLDAVPRGKIIVDAGAKRALQNNASLLPSGIVDVKGSFVSGEVVLVVDEEGNAFLRAVPNFSSSELKAMLGHHSKDIEMVLGHGSRNRVVFRPEDTSPANHDE